MIYDLSVLPPGEDDNAKKLWEFYTTSGFVYPAKALILEPYKDQIMDTVGKLLGCQNNACRYIFIVNHDEIIGSVMALQYSDESWAIQHFAVLPQYRHSAIAKELLMSIVSWAIYNKEMKYFQNYFQPKTKIPLRIFTGMFSETSGDKHMSLEQLDYQIIKIDDYHQKGVEYPGISVREMAGGQESVIYRLLETKQNKITLLSLGIKPDDFSINKTKEKYKNIGLLRDRKYMVAQQEGEIVGFALADISSLGVNLSQIFDSFRIFVFDGKNKANIMAILIGRLIDILKENKKHYAIALAGEEDREDYRRCGFKLSRIYMQYNLFNMEGLFIKMYNRISKGGK
jgi:GNAT superfamily N-acetyltransferase